MLYRASIGVLLKVPVAIRRALFDTTSILLSVVFDAEAYIIDPYSIFERIYVLNYFYHKKIITYLIIRYTEYLGMRSDLITLRTKGNSSLKELFKKRKGI